MHGNYGPNMLTNKADVILAVGMRFDDRVTGRLADYAKQAKIIHIDIDPAELNKNIHAEVPIVSDAKTALQELQKYLKKSEHTKWVQQFRKYAAVEKEKVISKELKPLHGPITMGEVIDMVAHKTKQQAILVADVGQHQMKTARYGRFKKSRSFITSGGAGTMGYALPAAVGAKMGRPDRTVVAFIGDGGFQMTIQELGTVMQENLPVKIIILNNNFLGMVRQWQELFFDRRYSFVELNNPDFIQIAKGFRIDGEEVTQRTNLASAIDRMLTHTGPYILNVIVGKEENVFPMIPTGAAVDEVRLE
jgi:acetolactate synthase-1/2/3 large subunit